MLNHRTKARDRRSRRTLTLIISGQRRLPVSSESQIHRLEIPYGCFERKIELPIGHFEIGMRELIHGCLLVLLRKI